MNVAFAFGFIASLLFAYGSFVQKRAKDPTLPWFAFFFKVEGQSSWMNATPFKS